MHVYLQDVEENTAPFPSMDVTKIGVVKDGTRMLVFLSVGSYDEGYHETTFKSEKQVCLDAAELLDAIEACGAAEIRRVNA